jgi:hypothetical protein
MKEKSIVFLKHIWKNSHLVVFFVILGVAVMSWQLWRRPDLYKVSQTLEVIPFKIDSSDTKPADNETALRLYSQIEGDEDSSSIKNLIEKNNLFKEERANGESFDLLVKKVSSGLAVNNVVTREDLVISFDLSYYSTNRENAENLISALAKQVIDSPINARDKSKIRILSACCQRTEAVAPRRFFMITLGLFAGLFTGLLVAALSALRRRKLS